MRMPFAASLLCLFAVALAHGCGAGTSFSSSEPIRVAAASDLTPAFGELARDFERVAGRRVALTFGSTGMLARQLGEGAPFDVFAAASASYVDDAVRAQVCNGATRAIYGQGRLVLWSTGGQYAQGAAPEVLSDLAEVRFVRIAIANPEHDPYGKAAREALMSAGVWQRIEPRLVYADNVWQALQVAQTGHVDAAIVALSLVIGERRGVSTLIDAPLHKPIEQVLVACSHGKDPDGGRRFASYVNAPAGHAVMKRFGFLLPGETLVRAR